MTLVKAKHSKEAGFTIIELLIATAVFSIVLLLMIVGVINFYKGYYKSLISASTQNAVQNISDIVGQDIKTNSALTTHATLGVPSQNSSTYSCIGSTEFAYRMDATYSQTGSSPFTGPPFVLYEFSPASGCGGATPNPWNDANWKYGTSLLGDHYRLLDFNITSVSVNSKTDWAIDVKIAYTNGGTGGNGDDLLCSPTLPSGGNGGCGFNNSTPIPYNNATAPNPTVNTANDVQCRIGSGSQFCYVAELQSIVGNRL